MGRKDDLIHDWRDLGIIDERIIQAFIDIKREDFILNESIDFAYSDNPLPIGFGQTISQPTTVILMLKYLELKPEHNVLEIGAGSGYNAALMSKLSKTVYTIERISGLVEFAKANLLKARIGNVKVIKGDGSNGHIEASPYDRIIVTAAVPEVPDIILKQLKVGGILLAPIGNVYKQRLIRITKTEKGKNIEDLGAFRFVPLIGKYGFKAISKARAYAMSHFKEKNL